MSILHNGKRELGILALGITETAQPLVYDPRTELNNLQQQTAELLTMVSEIEQVNIILVDDSGRGSL
jgi:hypothetical protein